MEVSLLKNILFVLFLLSSIWLALVVIKRETENLLRALLICILFGAVLFFLQGADSETISWAGIRAQVKQTFFPEKKPNYVYHKEESETGRTRYVRFFFENPGPKLSARLDSKQRYFEITDIYSVNRILTYVGLPKVKAAVPELASLTGSSNDITIYRWEDYPLGILTIERGICQ
ncbi:MAG: hypothetical protein AB1715_10550, partial [Acidobacteriota bacterium]